MAHDHVMAIRAGYNGEIWAECVDLYCDFRIEEAEIIAVIRTQYKWVLSDEVYGIREKQLKEKRAARQEKEGKNI